MTPDQAKALEEVLQAAEEWLLAIIWSAERGRNEEGRKQARGQLVDEIDAWLAWMEADDRDHGGLGRGGGR